MGMKALEYIEFGKARLIGTTPRDDWRVRKPVVDANLCRRCWLCLDYCIEGCMNRMDEAVVIDLRFCKGCGVCANECPADAIEMVEERG
ncbi:MAG: 4Fe-4S binding protein [Candidatus Geothermarchaeales archaeon]